MSRAVSACVLSLLACVASAQEPDALTYDGTWSARLQGNDGKRREATVIIAGYDGTWQDRSGGPAVCGAPPLWRPVLPPKTRGSTSKPAS